MLHEEQRAPVPVTTDACCESEQRNLQQAELLGILVG